MKKNKLILLFTLVMAFNASAAIRVYDAATGSEKSIKVLEQNGAFNDEFQELTEEQKKNITKQDLIKYMQQVPDHQRPIEKQLVKGLGTVIYFTSLDALDNSQGRVMDSILAIDGIRSEFYIKPIKANSARMLMALKLGGEFKGRLKEDAGDKIARRLHVSSYPQIVYIAPDKSRAMYSGSAGGVTALKMKIGEIKTILDLREKEKAEAEAKAKQHEQHKEQIKNMQNLNNNIRFN